MAQRGGWMEQRGGWMEQRGGWMEQRGGVVTSAAQSAVNSLPLFNNFIPFRGKAYQEINFEHCGTGVDRRTLDFGSPG